MKFVTQIRNPFGGTTLDEYIEKMVKQASPEPTQQPQVKTAAGKACAEGDEEHGVVISLPADKEFQKGESVTMCKKDKESKKPEKKETKASYVRKWEKVSKLNPTQKQKLRAFFEGAVKYPREYVDALLAD